MRKQLVVARYRENISWLRKTQLPAIVYDKHLTLPNVGREATTYLYHIIKNYDNLADITMFVQGEPFIHAPQFLELINSDFNKVTSLCQEAGSIYHGKNFKTDALEKVGDCLVRYSERKFKDDEDYGNLPLEDAWRYLFESAPPKGEAGIKFICGAQMAVPKEFIRLRSLNFWYRCIDWCENSSILNRSWSSYVFESLWLHIFNPDIIENPGSLPKYKIIKIRTKFKVAMSIKRILRPLIEKDWLETPDISRYGLVGRWKNASDLSRPKNRFIAYWHAISWDMIKKSLGFLIGRLVGNIGLMTKRFSPTLYYFLKKLRKRYKIPSVKK